MEKKYEFTGKTKVVCGTVVRQIAALRDFGAVRKGTAGGYIESEDNLSHEGLCWVGGEASVCGGARVEGDALVCDCARVGGRAFIGGSAVIRGKAYVNGDARVTEQAVVQGRATLGGRMLASGITAVDGGRRVRSAAHEAVIHGRNTVLAFGQHRDSTAGRVADGGVEGRLYLVWCYANLERFDLERSFREELGVRETAKPGTAPEIYDGYRGSLPQEVRDRLSAKVLKETAHKRRAEKERKRAELESIRMGEREMCRKCRLQAYNQGHTGR